MEVKINTLEKDRPRVPLKVGQVRLNEEKDEIILVTSTMEMTFGIAYLKNKYIFSYVPLEQKDFTTVEKDFPIVADSTSLMINIK